MARFVALLFLLPLLAGCAAPSTDLSTDGPAGSGPDAVERDPWPDPPVPPNSTTRPPVHDDTGNHSVADREEPDMQWEYEGGPSTPPEEGPPVVESRVEHSADSLAFSWRLGPEATLRGVERGDCDCPAEARFLEGWWSVRVDDLRNVAEASLRVHVAQRGENWTVVLTADVPLRVLRFGASPEAGCVRVVAAAAGVEEPRWSVLAEPLGTGEAWRTEMGVSWDGESFCWSPPLRPLVADAPYRLQMRLHDGERSVLSEAVEVRTPAYPGEPVTDVSVDVDDDRATFSWLLDGEPNRGGLWLLRDGNLTEVHGVRPPSGDHPVFSVGGLAPGTHAFVVTWTDGTMRSTGLRTFVVPA